MIPSAQLSFISPFVPLPPAQSQTSTLHVSRNTLRACAASLPMDKLLTAARHNLSRTDLEITSIQWDSRVLTLFLSRPNGNPITADDCADASAIVGQAIEEGKYLGDAPYTLQVSTPGVSDVLTQQHEFDAFQGFPVRVKTAVPVNGNTCFWGTLKASTTDVLRIAVKGRIIQFKRHLVEEIRLCTPEQVKE